MPIYCNLIFATLLFALSTTVVAANPSNDFNVAGFATFAYGKTFSDSDEGDVIANITPEGQYRDFNQFGLRFDKELQNKLVVTAQVISRGNKDYTPEFDWIYATYTVNPNITLDVGRFRAPLYLYSDVLNVSYAYQWIAPPLAVYNANQTPFNSLEGVQLTYNTSFMDWTSELKLWYGSSDEDFTTQGLDTTLELDESYGIALELSRKWLTMRAFYYDAISTADIYTSDNQQLIALLNGLDVLNQAIQTIDSSADIMKDVLWEEDKGYYYGLGFNMDFEKIFIVSEFTAIRVEYNAAAPKMDSGYVMAGYRLLDTWALSLTYAEDDDSQNNNIWQQLDDYRGIGLDAQIDVLQPGLKLLIDDLQSSRAKTWTLGSRWDFHHNASLKAEYFYQINNSDLSDKQKPHGFRLALDLVF